MAEKLPFDRTQLFSEIEPRLQLAAKKFGRLDHDGEAKSFFLNFCELWDKIEADVDHDVRMNRATGKVETNKEKLKNNLTAYMVANFKYALLIERRKSLKDVNRPTVADTRPAQQQEELLIEALDSSDIRIGDLIEMMENDSAALDDSVNIFSQEMKVFIDSCVAHFVQVKKQLGNIPVVADRDANRLRRFFVPGLVYGLTDSIRSHLLERAALQTNRAFVRRIAVLCDVKNNSGALKRRLQRYMVDYKGGWAKRLLVRYDKKKQVR